MGGIVQKKSATVWVCGSVSVWECMGESVWVRVCSYLSLYGYAFDSWAAWSHPTFIFNGATVQRYNEQSTILQGPPKLYSPPKPSGSFKTLPPRPGGTCHTQTRHTAAPAQNIDTAGSDIGGGWSRSVKFLVFWDPWRKIFEILESGSN